MVGPALRRRLRAVQARNVRLTHLPAAFRSSGSLFPPLQRGGHARSACSTRLTAPTHVQLLEVFSTHEPEVGVVGLRRPSSAVALLRRVDAQPAHGPNSHPRLGGVSSPSTSGSTEALDSVPGGLCRMNRAFRVAVSSCAPRLAASHFLRDFLVEWPLTLDMTFWLLAVILLLSLAGLGYRLGILFGVWLAGPLSGLVVPLLKPLGVKNPIALWILPPFVVFCVVSALFKTGAAFLHKKVEMYYKYQAGDLRLALWERLMARLGLCLGVLNGTAYLILISFIIYSFGYWTVQVGDPQTAKWPVKLLNRLAWDLDGSGFVKTAHAMDPFPESYYETADIAGLVYQNSPLEARLKRYPPFLILGEDPAFQKLGSDTAFADMRLRQAPLKEVLADGNVDAILKNAALIDEIWSTVEPNLQDLDEYLHTGISPRFSDETLYGRWRFNASASAASLRKDRPNISSKEMKRTRQILEYSFGRASLVIGTEERLVAKDFSTPAATVPGQPPPPSERSQGRWRKSGDDYKMTFDAGGKEVHLDAVVQGERLTVSGFEFPLVFDREV